MSQGELIDRLYEIIETQNRLLHEQSVLLQMHGIMDPSEGFQIPEAVKEEAYGFSRQI